ncbi:MAG: branched-chain amino acid ABC transporter permease [Desulfobacterales bacterium]|nr:branched-chain amino acid ABC transporter permease [Desulfobacterales bacterium]MDP3316667.1 branched-chain amino acid ABC transporter permease [Devosia sp.]
MSLELLLQSTLSGLLMGAMYALISIPLAMSFGVMRVLNFAHGELLMCAMYGAVLLNKHFGMGPYTTILVLAPAMGLVGFALFHGLIKPLLKSSMLMQAQFTLGLSFVIQSAALLIFGADLFNIRSPVGVAVLTVAGIAISVPLIIGLAVSMSICGALAWVLLKTEWGYRVRATAQDPAMALMCGIPVPRIHAAIFAGGTAILGIAAGCLMAFFHVTPHVGVQFSLLSLLIVVLGGLGDLKGTFYAGLLIGLTESLASALFNSAATPAAVYILFGVVLLFRPKGLFGRGSVA